jgi:hypothetical protein
MRHRASRRFWRHYRDLPEEIQRLADRGYELLVHLETMIRPSATA